MISVCDPPALVYRLSVAHRVKIEGSDNQLSHTFDKGAVELMNQAKENIYDTAPALK